MDIPIKGCFIAIAGVIGSDDADVGGVEDAIFYAGMYLTRISTMRADDHGADYCTEQTNAKERKERDSLKRNLSRSLALSGLAVNVGVLTGVREGLMRGKKG